MNIDKTKEVNSLGALRFPLFILITFLCGQVMLNGSLALAEDTPSKVEIIDKVMYVDGSPYVVKGVNYSPFPIGYFRHYGQDFNGTCHYVGPIAEEFPPYFVPHPDERFEFDSPDAVNGFDCLTKLEPAHTLCQDNPFQEICSDPDELFKTESILTRDFTLIEDMNANTIRVFNNVTEELLDAAHAHGLKVIAFHFVYPFHDFIYLMSEAGAVDRQNLINEFVSYVNQFKNHPAVLMWGLGNEANIHFCNECIYEEGTCDVSVQAAAFYELMNLMADAAHNADTNHPVMVTSADLPDHLANYGHLMQEVDIIGMTSYRGYNFNGFPDANPNLFEKFEGFFSDKPMLVAEFGADAWNVNGYDDNPENGYVDENAQMAFMMSQWREITKHLSVNGGPTLGGVAFSYEDGWFKNSRLQMEDQGNNCAFVSSEFTPSVFTHDHDFFDPSLTGVGNMPDDRMNEEWWGLTALVRDGTGDCDRGDGLDCMVPRKAYYTFQEMYAPGHVFEDDGFNFSVSSRTTTDDHGPSVIKQGGKAERVIDLWTLPALKPPPDDIRISKPAIINVQALPPGIHLEEPMEECSGINCSRSVKLIADENALVGEYQLRVIALAKGYTVETSFPLIVEHMAVSDPSITISGRVVNIHTGQGESGVRLRILGMSRYLDRTHIEVYTDASGNFRFTDLQNTRRFQQKHKRCVENGRCDDFHIRISARKMGVRVRSADPTSRTSSARVPIKSSTDDQNIQEVNFTAQ